MRPRHPTNALPGPACVSCAYDNSGLPEGAPCTECGAEHYWAIGGPCTSPEHIRWFRSIARAHLWFLFAFLLWSCALTMIALLAFAESSSFFPRNHSGLNEYRVIALGYAGAAMTSLLFSAVAWRTRRLFRPFF